MADLSSSKLQAFSRWLPVLFGLSAILYVLTWWLRGNITNLYFGIGMALVAQQSYFYPKFVTGSLRTKSGPLRYKLASETLSTVGFVTLISAMVASWL